MLAAAGALAGLGFWVERNDSVGTCEGYEVEDPPARGCLNLASIRDQRDVALGLAIGLGAAALGAGVAWIVVAATQSDEDPHQTTVRCAPGLVGLACAGRF